MNLSWRTISPLFAFFVLGLSIACGPVALPTNDAGSLPDAVISPDTSNLPCVGDKCGQCESDQDCTFAKENITVFSFRCHPDQLVCVECLVDGDCGTAGRCNPSTSECVACLADKHCTTGVCAIGGNFCVECLADIDCKSGHCDGNTNTCLGCIDDKECNDNNPCTIDLCGDSGCTKEVAADGQKCDAGPCTLNDQCVGGKCVAGEDDPACDVCETDEACLVGEWCARDVGQCGDFEGLCSPKPTLCDELKATQVCGCDNKTYPSNCKAHGSGVNILHKGPCCPDFKCIVGKPLDSDQDGCVDTCSCTSSEDCGPGDFCEVKKCLDFSDLGGASDDLGVCKSCKLTGAVCGCDSTLYANGCKASNAGTVVATQTADVLADCCKPLTCDGGGIPTDTDADGCADTCGCSTTKDCGPKQVCLTSSCDAPAGSCVSCNTPFENKVCGCNDGDTFDTLCEAANDNQVVPQDGECGNSVAVECTETSDCSDPDQYCAKVKGSCDGSGTCKVKPDKATCKDAKKGDVCGCDGDLYSSECEANHAGFSIKNDGACAPPTEEKQCKSNEKCLDDTTYCLFSEGDCGKTVAGFCTTMNIECNGVDVFPVCGCDNKDYQSVCHAQQAGVSVQSEGKCVSLNNGPDDKKS